MNKDAKTKEIKQFTFGKFKMMHKPVSDKTDISYMFTYIPKPKTDGRPKPKPKAKAKS